MRLLNTTALALAVFSTQPNIVAAQSREVLGQTSMFNNDAIGDGRDRWRTGSFSYSVVWGQTDYAPQTLSFGDIIDFRARSEIMAPLSDSDSPGDRLYVGALALGVNTFKTDGTTQYTIGAEVVATGPQTGVSTFQQNFHEKFDLIPTSYVDEQLEDAFYFGLSGEGARSYALSDTVTVRPFVQAQLGIETLARVGADFVIGTGWRSDVMLRDNVTGQIYGGVDQPQETGVTFLLGADMAYVADSVYLPESRGYDFEETRARLRAGAAWQITEDASVYYGLTYLSPEFKDQNEGQTTGSLQVKFKF